MIAYPGDEGWSRFEEPFLRVLDPAETSVLLVRANKFKFRFSTIDLATVMLTDSRLLVSKDRMFGKHKVDVSLELTDIASTGYGPLMGVGPTWEAHFRTVSDEPGIMYLDPPVAEAFTKALTEAAKRTVDPPPAAAGSSNDQLEVALARFAAELGPLTDGQSAGTPFGPGAGLEEAKQAAIEIFGTHATIRAAGKRFAAELLMADDPTIPSFVPGLMGSTPEAMSQAQLSPAVATDVNELSGAAQVFLSQFEGAGNMWDLWNANDEVALEFLCWHGVARLRLASEGRMPAFQAA